MYRMDSTWAHAFMYVFYNFLNFRLEHFAAAIYYCASILSLILLLTLIYQLSSTQISTSWNIVVKTAEFLWCVDNTHVFVF